MKLLLVSLVIGALFLTSCGQSPAEPNASSSVDLNKIYKWRMVTTWPKNFPGMGTVSYTHLTLPTICSV